MFNKCAGLEKYTAVCVCLCVCVPVHAHMHAFACERENSGAFVYNTYKTNLYCPSIKRMHTEIVFWLHIIFGG